MTDQTPALTEAELVTLDLVSRGNSNVEIARHLHMSEDGIKSRLRKVFEKVGARDRAHAVRLGFEMGLLFTDDELSEVAS